MSKNLSDVLKAAYRHKGAAFIEIFQNCIVYNDDVFASFTAREFAADAQLWLEHGKPMLFAGGKRGIAFDADRLTLRVVDAAEQGDHVLIHDAANRTLAHLLVEMPFGAFPMALGTIYDSPAPTFESAVIEQNAAIARGKMPDLQALVGKGQSWEVAREPRPI